MANSVTSEWQQTGYGPRECFYCSLLSWLMLIIYNLFDINLIISQFPVLPKYSINQSINQYFQQHKSGQSALQWNQENNVTTHTVKLHKRCIKDKNQMWRRCQVLKAILKKSVLRLDSKRFGSAGSFLHTLGAATEKTPSGPNAAPRPHQQENISTI